MYKILTNRISNCLPIRLKTSRLMSGLNSEMDSETKQIQRWKRVFAFSLFGITLTTALIVKKYKRKQWFELLQQTKRLQGQKFGELELFQINNIVIAEPVLKVWRNVQSFVFRNEDLVLSAFPKSGITWLQEIVWLIDNDLDFQRAKSESISDRFAYLEFPTPGIKSIERMKNKRFIKTHLTPSVLFKECTDCQEINPNAYENQSLPKIISIFRNPKDLMVSYYHFSRMNKLIGYKEDFNDFFDRFINGTVPYGPFWAHYLDVLEWNETHIKDNRILIISFENLKKDFKNQINRICEFMGKPKLSEEDMNALEFHCSFDQMKNNPSVNYKHWDDLGFRDKTEAEFMRRGQIGDWKHYLTEEQNKIIEQLIADKFGNKLTFIYE